MSTPPPPGLAIARTDGVLYRVDIGATFLTGVEVDIASSLVNASDDGPAHRLERCESVPFRASRATLRRSDGSFYAVGDGDHGTEVIPRTLATVEASWLLASCDLSGAPEGWEVATAECDIHDYGVGMVVLGWRPSSPRDLSLGEADEVLAALSAASGTAVSGVVAQIATACRDALTEDPARLDLARGLDVESVAMLPPVGEVLWRWHMLLVSSAGPDHASVASRLAAVVCPNDFELLHHRDHTFAAGVHASVACSRRGEEPDARFLARSPRLQDPWWTLFWRLDRVLLALQLSLEANFDGNSHQELQTRADILADVSSRVDLLRSRMDSFLVSSGARDIDAWETLSAAWDTAYRVDVVDRKMELLGRAYGDAVNRIASNRMSRVNFMIYVFTAFSLVASVVAIVQFTQGVVDERTAVRVSIVSASVMASFLAVYLSVRTTRVVRARRDA